MGVGSCVLQVCNPILNVSEAPRSVNILTEDNDHQYFITELTAEVVAAYVCKNSLPASELPATIALVHAALERSREAPGAESVAEKPKPAVPINRSVTNDHIVCLEDGKTFKSLKRHIATHHGMTPDEYRRRWGLKGEYPMVAPGYSASRSKLAKSLGLGRKVGKKNI
ncbi:MucR family transcriptional regulator [Aurantimonas sp. DM33-3]|nr:MucR family transcriptional regulator [Aurantimonas sp. DM33-3]